MLVAVATMGLEQLCVRSAWRSLTPCHVPRTAFAPRTRRTDDQTSGRNRTPHTGGLWAECGPRMPLVSTRRLTAVVSVDWLRLKLGDFSPSRG